MHIHLDKKLTVGLLITTAIVSLVWHIPETALHIAKDYLFSDRHPAPSKQDGTVYGGYAPGSTYGGPKAPAKKQKLSDAPASYNPGMVVTDSYNPGHYETYNPGEYDPRQKKP